MASGQPTTIKNLALLLGDMLGSKMYPAITQKYRNGDIRHCIADISKIEHILNWKPKISLEEGLKELIKWAQSQKTGRS